MRLLLDETRVQWALAIFLALIAGYLDGYGTSFPGSLSVILHGPEWIRCGHEAGGEHAFGSGHAGYR